VPSLLDAGCELRILGRHPQQAADRVEYVRGDLTTGDGIAAAVAGAATIVLCAGSAKGDEVMTQHLVRAAAQAGSPPLVYIAVVGADLVPVVSGVDLGRVRLFSPQRCGPALSEMETKTALN
jgi:uncharacterized protein YbjT (DUF2867 family)